MTFKERLAKYKKESDYFMVDIYKGGPDPYETKRDLTWSEARVIFNRAKKNDKISRADIVVEDWDANENDEDYEDWLFYEVESVIKEPYQWKLHLDTFEMEPEKWRLA